MKPKRKKTNLTKHPRAQRQRIDRLEKEIVKLAISFARAKQDIEARIKQLEEDKTKLIAEIQKLAPSADNAMNKLIEEYRERVERQPTPVVAPPQWYTPPYPHPKENDPFPQWRITCKH